LLHAQVNTPSTASDNKGNRGGSGGTHPITMQQALCRPGQDAAAGRRRPQSRMDPILESFRSGKIRDQLQRLFGIRGATIGKRVV
jgi:hypothetical protein